MRLTIRTLICAAAAWAVCAAPAAAQTVWAVGDGAVAGPEDDQVAARIQGEGLDHLLYLGDVYETGTAAEFTNHYHPSFGRFKAVTYPTPGNHEWGNRAEGYDVYWGPRVRQPGAGGGHWYSFDLGGWHFVSLNTMEPSDTTSAQLAWLRADLARYPGTCTIAISHHPRYGTGPQWNTLRFEPVWAALSGHAVALLSGHVHNYQRHFPVRRVVQFVVGTGGRTRGNTDGRDPRLAASQDGVFGALRLRLRLGEAGFEFIPVTGGALDAGTLECRPHTPTPAGIRVLRPRNRGVYRTIRTLRGRASNTRRLRVKLVRRIEGRACRAWNGRAFEEASCRTRRSAPLRGRRTWKLRFRRRLRPGGYRLTIAARALDETLKRKTVRFRVR